MAVRSFFDPSLGASPKPQGASEEAELALPGADVPVAGDATDQLAQGRSAGPGGNFWLDPNSDDANFFDAHHAHAARIADKYAVDPALILGLAAWESSWGKSKDALDANNPLGMRPDGHHPIQFPSTEAAWDEWGRQFGPRVLGVGRDANTFLDQLLEDHRSVYGPARGGDYRGPYNSANSNWRDGVARTIQGVRRRLPRWQGNLDSLP
jgi:hypothetical protein